MNETSQTRQPGDEFCQTRLLGPVEPEYHGADLTSSPFSLDPLTDLYQMTECSITNHEESLPSIST